MQRSHNHGPAAGESARSIKDIAAQYVLARGRHDRLISIKNAVRAIRAVQSDCPYTDQELADIVATVAVGQGCNIHFDGGKHDTSKAPE